MQSYAEFGQYSPSLGVFFPNSALFPIDFTCMKTTISYDTDVQGYNTDIYMSPISKKLFQGCTCTVGPTAGVKCSETASLPIGAVPSTDYFNAFIADPVFTPYAAFSFLTPLPVLVKNTFSLRCEEEGESKRRASRRLQEDSRWFRYFEAQSYMGGTEAARYGTFGSLILAGYNYVSSPVINAKVIKVKVRASAPVYAYVVPSSIMLDYIVNSCASTFATCPAPLHLAVAKCRVESGDKDCKIYAELDTAVQYDVLLSTRTMFANPPNPVIYFKLTVDAIYQDGGRDIFMPADVTPTVIGRVATFGRAATLDASSLPIQKLPLDHVRPGTAEPGSGEILDAPGM